jgi:hypothetical protein
VNLDADQILRQVYDPLTGALRCSTGGAAHALSDALANPTAASDAAAWLIAWDGAQGIRVRVPSVYYDMNAVSITTIATVATPTSGKRMRVLGGSISVSAAVSVLFEDNAAGTRVFRTPVLLANTPYNFDLGGKGVLLAAIDRVLKATASAAATILGTIYGCEE